MIDISLLEDLSLLRESVTLECKLAGGRDGKGALPDDFWPTYSAMANTNGGMVILGVREKKGWFEIVGIENIDKVRKDLFNHLNNRNKTNVNLLTDRHVTEHEIDNKKLLVIEIPRAQRKQQPVYLTTNPFGNTYRRFNDGDKVLS
jgi:predicted HTH transcriptional regulator